MTNPKMLYRLKKAAAKRRKNFNVHKEEKESTSQIKSDEVAILSNSQGTIKELTKEKENFDERFEENE